MEGERREGLGGEGGVGCLGGFTLGAEEWGRRVGEAGGALGVGREGGGGGVVIR